MTTTPYFSIVMPVFNRPVAVHRAIDSCLEQDFDAFEVVVVDDGSRDRTVEAIAEYSDPRVRLILHPTNRGLCAARKSGVRASRGEWVIFLDSDDEMLPGCLSRIYQHLVAAGDRVDRFGFQYVYDDGRVTPSPMPPEPVVGYAEWVRWIDRALLTDALWVTRRGCFVGCPLPESFAPDFSYFLDFAKRFTSRMVPVTLALIHTDCLDRLSYLIPPADPEMVKRKARDEAADWRYVLAEHGDALRRLAPGRYEAVLRNAALSNLLAGDRGRAVEASLSGLRLRPSSLYAWITFLLVLAGPRAALLLTRIRSERRRGSNRAGASRLPRADLSQSAVHT
ncbi:MAG: glycosyltransferase family 2 protein [Bryobacteraceae bacterium]